MLMLKPATLLKVRLLHGFFSRLKNCAISTKSRDAYCPSLYTLSIQCSYFSPFYQEQFNQFTDYILNIFDRTYKQKIFAFKLSFAVVSSSSLCIFQSVLVVQSQQLKQMNLLNLLKVINKEGSSAVSLLLILLTLNIFLTLFWCLHC